MFNKSQIHLIPQPILDLAEKVAVAKHHNEQAALRSRLEAIRDFCDLVLKKETK